MLLLCVVKKGQKFNNEPASARACIRLLLHFAFHDDDDIVLALNSSFKDVCGVPAAAPLWTDLPVSQQRLQLPPCAGLPKQVRSQFQASSQDQGQGLHLSDLLVLLAQQIVVKASQVPVLVTTLLHLITEISFRIEACRCEGFWSSKDAVQLPPIKMNRRHRRVPQYRKLAVAKAALSHKSARDPSSCLGMLRSVGQPSESTSAAKSWTWQYMHAYKKACQASLPEPKRRRISVALDGARTNEDTIFYVAHEPASNRSFWLPCQVSSAPAPLLPPEQTLCRCDASQEVCSAL